MLFFWISLFYPAAKSHKKRTAQIVNDDYAVPIFADNFYNTFGEPIFDVNLSKRAAFYFYDLSLENRNRPHNLCSDNEELIVYLFNERDAGVIPNIIVQYHEWSLSSPAIHFIQFAHFSKRKRRLRVESPFAI